MNEQKYEICKLTCDLKSTVNQLSKRLNDITTELKISRNDIHFIAEERDEAEKQLQKAQEKFQNAQDSCDRILSDFTVSENALDSLSTEMKDLFQSELLSAQHQTIPQSKIIDFSFETKKGRFILL